MESISNIKRLSSFWRGSVHQTLATLDKPIRFTPLGPRPIILIPGAFCTSSVMNRLGNKLIELGRSVCVPPSFAYYYSALANLCRLPKAARDFIKWLDQAGQEYGFDQIDVVGHSNGGLIALLAQDMVDQGEAKCAVRVKRVFTMAAPFKGLPNAKVLSPMVPCCRDLIAGSDTLQRIARVRQLVVHCLVAEGDFLVPPASQFPEDQTRTVMEGFQHMDFIVGTDEKVERTAREIVKWLGTEC